MPGLSSVSITWDDEDRPVVTVRYGDQHEEPAPHATPEEWLAALVARLTDDSADKLRALLEANGASGPIALADLAAGLGVDKRKIDGWNRNLGRSIKAVVRDHGFLRKDREDGTSQLFDFEWDQAGNRWLYTVPERFRNALLENLDHR